MKMKPHSSMKITAAILIICLTNSMRMYAQPGELDQNFGTNGISTMTLGWYDTVDDVVIDSQGRIVAGGRHRESSSSTTDDVLIMRFKSNGSIDSSFGTNGIVIIDLGGDEECNSIAIDQNNRIVAGPVAGNQLICFFENGTIDSTFGNNGIASVGIYIPNIVIQNDDKILISSVTKIQRINSNGSVDSSFGTNGLFSVFWGADRSGIALQEDGKIILGSGYYDFDTDFSILRLNSNGTIDPSFNSGQFVRIGDSNHDEQVTSVVIQDDGKIVAGGQTEVIGGNPMLVRINSNGLIDSTFGTNGIKTLTSADLYLNSLLLQSDGKIVTIGEHYEVIRLKSSGQKDSTFGVNGKASASIGGLGGTNSSAFMTDGDILCAGSSTHPDSSISQEFLRVTFAKFISGLNIGVVEFTKQDNTLMIYPNPISANATMKYFLNRSEIISIELQSIQGNIIKTFIQNENQLPGEHVVEINLPADLPSNAYLLVVSSSSGKQCIKIIKQ